MPRPPSAAARVTILYIAVASAAIVIADRLAARGLESLRAVAWLETALALLLILGTSPLIYLERRRAEQRAGRLRAIVEATSDAIVGLDLGGVVSSWNRGAEHLFGYPASAALGMPLQALWPAVAGSDPHLELQPVLAAVALGRAQVLNDLPYRRPDGSTGRLAISLAAVRTSAEQIVGISVTARDMTTHWQAERALHLAEVGRLASGLVHEMRNPLNAMRMRIALLRRRLDGASQEGAVCLAPLAELEGEVTRIQELADHFLAYGRPTSERPRLVPLEPFLRRLEQFVGPEIAQAGCSLRLQPPHAGEATTVHMDPSKLEQVLLNLVRNAREAMAPGGLLTIAWSPGEAGMVAIEVRDTGPGMDADELERIFTAFYSTREGGTGLGLAIVRQIVEAAGGSVTVASHPGRGSCFRLLLPGREPMAAETARPPTDDGRIDLGIES